LLSLIERMDALDLSSVLVYRLDSVPDTALLYLAWQFDLLAPQWQLGAQVTESFDALRNIDAITNIDTLTSTGGLAGSSDFDSLRALLKVAIPLHRTRGTPYAIKTALRSLGWSKVKLIEGQVMWGGTSYSEGEGWAVFRAQINLDTGQVVARIDAARATAAINFFKPVRAWLDSLCFVGAPLEESLKIPIDRLVSIFSRIDQAPTPTDLIQAPAWAVVDNKTVAPLYDSHYFNAGITYGIGEPSVADSGVTINGVSIAAS
jgi:Phage tail protein (Tail_P2_I)